MQATKNDDNSQSSLRGGTVRPAPTVAVGVVCRRGDSVLLIRRGRAPRLGEWSIPGGKVHGGESLHDAALRELLEETGVVATISCLVEVYEIIDEGFHYVLIDYAADWVSGEPVAGDDADDARFMPLDEALACVVRDDLRDVLRKARS